MRKRLPAQHYGLLTREFYSPEMRARMDAREKRRRKSEQDRAWRKLCELEAIYSESAVPALFHKLREIRGDWRDWPLDQQAAACVFFINVLVCAAKDRIANDQPCDQYVKQIEFFRAKLADMTARDANSALKAKAGGAAGRRRRLEKKPKPDYQLLYDEVIRANPNIGRMSACEHVARAVGRNKQTVWSSTSDHRPDRPKKKP